MRARRRLGRPAEAKVRVGPVIIALCGILVTSCMVSHTMTPNTSGRPCAKAEPIPATMDSVVTWYTPERSGDENTLDRWCATVGPAIIDSSATARFPDWQPGDSLALLTWNVNVGGGDLLAFLSGELDVMCSAGQAVTGAKFAHFVLLLQEAHRISEKVPRTPPGSPIPPRIVPGERPGERVDVVEAARACGLSLVYVPSMRNGDQSYDEGREDKGNAIISTLPLSDVFAIELPFEAQRKVAVGAIVGIPPNAKLRTVNIHFDVSSTLFRSIQTGNSGRLRQALGLVEALELLDESQGIVSAESGSFTTPTLAAGDFNTWSASETALQHLRKYFPDSPPWDGQATRTGFPTDHIFFAAGTDSDARIIQGSYRRIENRYYSDHNARIVWVRVGNEGGQEGQ